MQCPKCGGTYVQAITETESSSKGYGFGKGCLGYLFFGPIGWLCGLCGMGKTKSKSRTFWLCNTCGHRFGA